MADMSISKAASAYRDATRIAERIVEETDSDQASPVAPTTSMSPSFQDLVSGSLDSARDVGYKKEAVSTQSIAKEAELHDLITAVSSAELTLNTVVAIRDRVINAYQDIIKMPI